MNEMNEGNNLEKLEFDMVPTVMVGLERGTFKAEVIELYELPFEKVMKALGTSHGPAQMMAMLEIFKLAVVDQTKLSGLEVLSFNELADILGQWASLSTPPVVSGASDASEVKPRKLVHKVTLDADDDDPEVTAMIDKVLDPDTSFEDLMEIAEYLASRDSEEDEEPRKRGRHAKDESEDDLF